MRDARGCEFQFRLLETLSPKRGDSRIKAGICENCEANARLLAMREKASRVIGELTHRERIETRLLIFHLEVQPPAFRDAGFIVPRSPPGERVSAR